MIERIRQSFDSYLKSKSLTEDGLVLPSFLTLYIDYYNNVVFKDLDRDNDEDMLLFQYGTYDWGDGRFFEVDFTRQFCESFPDEEDVCMYQQHVTFYFDPVGFENIASFNIWSRDCSDLRNFQSLITNSDGYLASLEAPLLRRAIVLEEV